jgi:hypothetical protein
MSPTEIGKMHDIALAKEYPILLPIGSILKQDLGFIGHHPPEVVVEMPFKKPKNGELTFGQAIFNKLFNSTRVVIEHANSGVKRIRMVKDIIRIHATDFRDRIMAVACALHNLRVTSEIRKPKIPSA